MFTDELSMLWNLNESTFRSDDSVTDGICIAVGLKFIRAWEKIL